MGLLRLARETRRDARFVAGVLKQQPFQVLVQVTNRCNMRCTFCAFWRNGVPPPQELTVSDFRRLSDELAELGCFLVSIEGGEPLLRPDILEIVEAFGRHHVPVLFTNGWRVDEAFAQGVYEAGAAQVGVSIDFPDAPRHDEKRGLAGGFDRAWAAVDLLRAAAPHGGRQVHVMTVVMQDNARELDALLAMSAARQVGHCLTLLSLDGFRRDCDRGDALPGHELAALLPALWRKYAHLRTFRSYLDRVGTFLSSPEQLPRCEAGKQTFNIDHIGNVATCIERIDKPAGNMRDTPLRVLWERMRGDEEVASCQACWTYCRGFADALKGGSPTARLEALVDLSTRMRSR